MNMKKQIQLVVVLLSLIVVAAGCNGKNNKIDGNDTSDLDISNEEPSETADEEIQYDKDLKYDVYFEKNDPSNDENNNTEEDEINANSKDSQKEMDPERAALIGFDYSGVDTKGLSNETLSLFSPCAMYLENGTNTSSGDILSSKKDSEINEFLFYFLISNINAEKVHGYEDNSSLPTEQWRIKYDDWEYLLREVLNENDPQKVRDMMPTRFEGEEKVFYSSADNYVYMEKGANGYALGAEVREVKREGDAYIITYDVCNYFSGYAIPNGVVEVTIAESNNKYGFSLVSVDVIKTFEEWR